MSPVWRFRSGFRGAILLRATLAAIALLAFLAVRNAAPNFPNKPSLNSTFSAGANHAQRLSFDRDDSHWAAFLRPGPGFVPAVAVVGLPMLRSSFSLESMGSRCDRAPPVAHQT
jgi:hypothetical protein